MPRKPLIYTNEHPYHITGRSNNKDWFDQPIDDCYRIFSQVLLKVVDKYKFDLHAFILMHNHYHMILSTPLSNISAGMRYFTTEASRGIRDNANRVNHVFGGRYHWSLITSSEYYALALKYLYRNPVKAGLVSKVEDYSWSTISKRRHRLQRLVTPIKTGHDCHLDFENNHKLLEWLNEPQDKEAETRIANGLQRSSCEIKLKEDKIRCLLPLAMRP
jgi:putative transposase